MRARVVFFLDGKRLDLVTRDLGYEDLEGIADWMMRALQELSHVVLGTEDGHQHILKCSEIEAVSLYPVDEPEEPGYEELPPIFDDEAVKRFWTWAGKHCIGGLSDYSLDGLPVASQERRMRIIEEAVRNIKPPVFTGQAEFSGGSGFTYWPGSEESKEHLELEVVKGELDEMTRRALAAEWQLKDLKYELRALDEDL